VNEFLLAEVKSVEGKAPTGEFEAIISAPTLDRDGEIIDTRAFDPLPASIPIHAFHDFGDPVGRAVPRYESDGRLSAHGTFASTPRAQEIRQLVTEGVIGHMSVGFMAATRMTSDDGAVHITGAELLEASFVSVPSNRQAALVMAKAHHDAFDGLAEKIATQIIEALKAHTPVYDAVPVAKTASDRMAEVGKSLSDGLSGIDFDAIKALDLDALVERIEEKSTVTDPEQSPALVAADSPADVSVARTRAALARAHLALLAQ
jgi:HK97 family phage prohead protease